MKRKKQGPLIEEIVRILQRHGFEDPRNPRSESADARIYNILRTKNGSAEQEVFLRESGVACVILTEIILQAASSLKPLERDGVSAKSIFEFAHRIGNDNWRLRYRYQFSRKTVRDRLKDSATLAQKLARSIPKGGMADALFHADQPEKDSILRLEVLAAQLENYQRRINHFLETVPVTKSKKPYLGARNFFARSIYHEMVSHLGKPYPAFLVALMNSSAFSHGFAVLRRERPTDRGVFDVKDYQDLFAR